MRLNCPVTAIEHGQSGVRVSCKDAGRPATLDADYLVCAMSARMLRLVPVTPAFPPEKAFAIANVP